MSITQKELKTLLDYDATTGEFTWKIDRTRVKAGDKAGTTHKSGYKAISVNGKMYYAQKLAILWMDGILPTRVALKESGSCAYCNLVVITRL